MPPSRLPRSWTGSQIKNQSRNLLWCGGMKEGSVRIETALGVGQVGKGFYSLSRQVLAVLLPDVTRRKRKDAHRASVPPCLPIYYPGGNRPEGQRRRRFFAEHLPRPR